ARRDSITAQLANVRQMLATLGGPQSAFADPLNVRSAQAWASETDAVDEEPKDDHLKDDQQAEPAAEDQPTQVGQARAAEGAEAAEVVEAADAAQVVGVVEEEAQSTTP
ncbi:MAG: hypothetical protein WBL05_06545, partial [Brooklawnia sp.]